MLLFRADIRLSGIYIVIKDKFIYLYAVRYILSLFFAGTNSMLKLKHLLLVNSFHQNIIETKMHFTDFIADFLLSAVVFS